MSDLFKACAMILSDEHGRVAYWNASATSLFGFEVSEAIGESVEILIPQDYVAPHWEGFRRAMESGQCKIDGAVFHLPVKCKDGVTRMFPARFVFLRNAYGQASGAMVLFSKHSETAEPFAPVLSETAAGAVE